MVAGYSGTPLVRKLGIKAGSTVALLNAPDGFEGELVGLPDGVALKTAARGTNDVILSFHTQRTDLERRVPTLREVFLPLGLVDNKVCAITDVWSGLRLVWRKENR